MLMLPGIFNNDVSIKERLDFISKCNKYDKNTGKPLVNTPDLISMIHLERIRIYTMEYPFLTSRISDEEYLKRDDRLMDNASMVEFNIVGGNFIHSMILDYASGEYEFDGVLLVLSDIIRYFNERVDLFNECLCADMKDNFYAGYYVPITPEYINNMDCDESSFFPNTKEDAISLLGSLGAQIRMDIIDEIIR